MKTIIPRILIFVLLTIIIFSCKDSTNQVVNKALEGTWYTHTTYIDGSRSSSTSLIFSFVPSDDGKGISFWNVSFTDAVEIPYSVINDGESINFDGDIFKLQKLTEDEIMIQGISSSTNKFWKIEADKTF